MKKILLIALLMYQTKTFALPQCKDKKEILNIDNRSAINLKENMEKGFKTRLLISGIITKNIANYQGHTHIEIDLDQDLNSEDDRIEVIFSNQYGLLPETLIGKNAIACGDFIIDPFSPNGAIIHWLHSSPSTKKHDHGYLMINDQIFGQK